MRTPEEFEAFLRDEIAPRLQAVERERAAVEARRDAMRVALGWKLASAAAGLALTVASGEIEPLLGGIAAPWLVESLRRLRVRDTATPLARSSVLEPVVAFWDPSFRYQRNGSIPRGEFEASWLFAGELFDTYTGEDLVTGCVGSTRFRFCEAHARRVVRRKGRTESRSVFRGLFFVADCNKEFAGRTLVLPDRAERALGSLGRSFQALTSPGDLELIELECPEFERAFVVRTTDPVEARYLLSPSLMERIRGFSRNTGSKLRIAFHGGRIYLALPLERDLFALRDGPERPGLVAALGSTSAPLTLDDVRRWSGELLFGIGIIDALDLDTRIWSKPPAA